MSFYNPNIQSAFDADKREYIVLNDVDLPTYTMLFHINEGCVVRKLEDIKAAYQLEFICVKDINYCKNLDLVEAGFTKVLGEIALEVLCGRVKTFDEFLSQKAEHIKDIDYDYFLFCGVCIRNFIELLIFSDISFDKIATGEKDYTKANGIIRQETNFPIFYNLYERLKLFAFLQKNILLEINLSDIQINNRQILLKLKLSI